MIHRLEYDSTLASMESENIGPPGISGPVLSTDEVDRIARYCAEEVVRQGRFAPQVGDMIAAWMDALRHQYHGDTLTVGMIRNWGCMIEPTKNEGFRTVPIYVGNGWTSVPKTRPDMIIPRFDRWFELLDNMTPLEAYIEFEEIHPFLDGNGRTGKIILNWLNGTLLEPVFPANDIWGDWIRNP